jgi:hypothetical protein
VPDGLFLYVPTLRIWVGETLGDGLFSGFAVPRVNPELGDERVRDGPRSTLLETPDTLRSRLGPDPDLRQLRRGPIPR